MEVFPVHQRVKGEASCESGRNISLVCGGLLRGLGQGLGEVCLTTLGQRRGKGRQGGCGITDTGGENTSLRCVVDQ